MSLVAGDRKQRRAWAPIAAQRASVTWFSAEYAEGLRMSILVDELGPRSFFSVG